ncbi:hypothetical protein [Nonomuraea sp. B5E05]|uniref:hypothetical protein n=1 Tax=Nonomuraea sp. B5E05 TaxID=3153569 RepID=UPI0032601F0D
MMTAELDHVDRELIQAAAHVAATAAGATTTPWRPRPATTTAGSSLRSTPTTSPAAPALKVIVGARGSLRTVTITDLLPDSYVWADHQLDAEEGAPPGTR